VRHRKIEARFFSQTRRQIDQERYNSALGAPVHQNSVFLQTLQFSGRVCKEKTGDSIVADGERLYRLAAKVEHLAAGRGLGAKRVRRFSGKAK
jgi:hypothetical protein